MNTNDNPGQQGAHTTGRAVVSWRLAAGAAIGAALLTSCGGGQLIFLGDQSSAYNQEITRMSVWAIGLSIIIFIGVSAALFYTVQKFREDKNTAEPQQFHGNNKLEVALVVVPVVIVFLLTVLAVKSLARLNPVSAQALPIEALGKQFWWNFGYIDAANTKDPAHPSYLLTNGNEMIIPVHQPIAVTATSGDVIHGFWAPNLGGQRAALPDSRKTWVINTDKAGVYQGNCSQLCGDSHANMRFKVVALPQDRYDTFVKAATAYKAPVPAAGTAEERGMNLFMKGNLATGAIACASCHRVQGTAANGASGPDLSFFGTRRTLGAGIWEALGTAQWQDQQPDRSSKVSPAQALHQWIKQSPVVKPGSLMPRYDGGEYRANGKLIKGGTLTDAQIDDISAYLRSLKLPTEADYWKGMNIVGTNTTVGGNQ